MGAFDCPSGGRMSRRRAFSRRQPCLQIWATRPKISAFRLGERLFRVQTIRFPLTGGFGWFSGDRTASFWVKTWSKQNCRELCTCRYTDFRRRKARRCLQNPRKGSAAGLLPLAKRPAFRPAPCAAGVPTWQRSLLTTRCNPAAGKGCAGRCARSGPAATRWPAKSPGTPS
jgi:hypothetical protein